MVAWACVRYESHSGFCFDDCRAMRLLGLSSPRNTAYHDFHHTVNKGNFGSAQAEYLDWLFGTQQAWGQGGGYEGYRAKKVPSEAGNVLGPRARAAAKAK